MSRRKGTDRHLVSPTHPALMTACRLIEPGERLEPIMDLMERCCKRGETKGAGLAAPQVGQCIQLIYIAMEGSPDRKPFFMINPKMTDHSESTNLMSEGCLSYPGVKKVIARYDWIEVTYEDARRRLVEERLIMDQFPARVVQHELDHLVGRCRVGDDSPADGVIPEREYDGGGALALPLIAALCGMAANQSYRR